MTEEENKEFNLLQLADDMSYKNWMYFKFLYNKKFKESEDRIKELEAALRDPTLDMLIAGKKSLYSCSEDPELDDARKCFKAMIAALGEKKDV
jgi:hypothetical protein